jgi:signal peptide peptidase SppA
MQAAPFSTPYFALHENYVPALLAGPEGRVPHKAPTLASNQIGVFGVLGNQGDFFADSNYASIRTQVRRALADPNVRTIDLVIDSPGGSCLGLPETANAIYEAGRVKPTRALISGIAASAAFWLASQASTITLTPSGEVGSVGILNLHTDITKALDTAGVRVTAVHAGEHKVERAPFTPLSDDAKAHMQSGVDRWYGDFLSTIRRGRGARVSGDSNFGGGRMLSARQALQAGMVDFVQPL